MKEHVVCHCKYFAHTWQWLSIIFNIYRPDTQSYIEKMKKEEQEKIKGAQGDNRSFFAKYVSKWIF